MWAMGAIGLGLGTAVPYRALLATVDDVAHPAWRASAVGVYRLWRDAGFVAGALLSGVIADLFGLVAAIWVVAGITAVGAAIVAVRMYETHPRGGAPANRMESLRSRELLRHDGPCAPLTWPPNRA